MTTYQNKTGLEWAETACQSLMDQYQPILLPPENRWHYHQGVFLCGMYDVWLQTKNKVYFDYVKEYVDKLVDEQGNFLFARGELDAIQPGLLLLPLYQETGDKRYQLAALKLRNLLKTLNRTKQGGFWHKDKYPYQMWLDGLYMAGPFAIQYGQMFRQPELIDLIMHQEKLMRENTFDKKTGLYFHGYDESKETPWATAKGHAPEIWGRALGWYSMVLVNFIELLEDGHPKKEELRVVVQQLIDRLLHYQDKETGLWYQVIDKGEREDNWLESSCSSLFVYAIAKAVNKGYISEKYFNNAKIGYQGILKHMVSLDENTIFQLHGISIGTSIGVYDYYINRETSVNDLHGVGAFILASVQIDQHDNN